MVLRREVPAKLRGGAKYGGKISARLDWKLLAGTKAGKTGVWKLEIPAQCPGGPHYIEIQSNDKIPRLDNVLFGDLWLCSGQSNMEWTMALIKAPNDTDIASCENPKIRLFTASKNATTKMSSECSGERLECKPENLSSFSAV